MTPSSLFALHTQQCPQVSRLQVALLAKKLLGLLLPHFRDHPCVDAATFGEEEQSVRLQLDAMLSRLGITDAAQVTEQFFKTLPQVQALLVQDAEATFAGDPAAASLDEVLLAYPGFTATALYRLAHEVYRLDVPLLPRLITELAHSRTGIDLHPGAEIGPYFCIDHGTGIVVGQTAVLGHHVKLYQGVTLGALSVRKELAQHRRHPTLGNYVVVYAGATILGGEVVIGDHSIIGGNVWLTDSVPPHTRVYYKGQLKIESAATTELLEYYI